MKIEDQFYISGRGLVVTGHLDEGEPWPRLETVPCYMPDGSFMALPIVGIESAAIIRDGRKPRRGEKVGLQVRGIDKSFSLIGGIVNFERRCNKGYAGGERRKK